MPTRYFVERADGSRLGPLDVAEVRFMARRGQIALTDLLSQEGRPNTLPAWRTKGLFPESMLQECRERVARGDSLDDLVARTADAEARSESAPMHAAVDLLSPEPDETWYWKHGDQVLGPVTTLVLRSMLTSGQVRSSSPVRRGEAGAWLPPAVIPELRSHLPHPGGARSRTTRSGGGSRFALVAGLLVIVSCIIGAALLKHGNGEQPQVPAARSETPPVADAGSTNVAAPAAADIQAERSIEEVREQDREAIASTVTREVESRLREKCGSGVTLLDVSAGTSTDGIPPSEQGVDGQMFKVVLRIRFDTGVPQSLDGASLEQMLVLPLLAAQSKQKYGLSAIYEPEFDMAAERLVKASIALEEQRMELGRLGGGGEYVERAYRSLTALLDQRDRMLQAKRLVLETLVGWIQDRAKQGLVDVPTLQTGTVASSESSGAPSPDDAKKPEPRQKTRAEVMFDQWRSLEAELIQATAVYERLRKVKDKTDEQLKQVSDADRAILRVSREMTRLANEMKAAGLPMEGRDGKLVPVQPGSRPTPGRDAGESPRSVEVACAHCGGDGRLTGKDQTRFTEEEAREWDDKVRQLRENPGVYAQPGTHMTKATIQVRCSVCRGKGKVTKD